MKHRTDNILHCKGIKMVIVKFAIVDKIKVKELSDIYRTSTTSIYNWIRKYQDEIHKKENEFVLTYDHQDLSKIIKGWE